MRFVKQVRQQPNGMHGYVEELALPRTHRKETSSGSDDLRCALDISNSLAECGMTYPFYEVDLHLMGDEKLSRTFCGAYLDQLYKDNDTPEKRKRLLLTGDRGKDLEMLMSEGRRFLPLQHFFWGIWNIICVQELGAIQGIDFLAHAKDRFIMYYRFKSNMYKY